MKNARSLSRRLVALSATVLTATMIAPVSHTMQGQERAVTARDAWVREAPAGRAVTAAFLLLTNTGSTARSVVSAACDAAETTELHEMRRTGASMEMAPVPAIAVAAGQTVTLKPGGLHLMLFGLKHPLTAGDTVRLTLTLDDGTRLSLRAPVRAMQGMP
ncbi:MAG: copper chaperone PCu(A)C [Gemmatimonadota bacterium]|nr:copper chaperone PCu(A)C [Gemmatimonadota bacterium]